MAEAAGARGQPRFLVLRRHVRQFLAQRVTKVPAQRLPEVAAEGAAGRLRDHTVDDAEGGEVGGADALLGGEFRGVAAVAVDDGAGPFRGQRGQPGVLGGEGAVGGQEGQGRAAGSLPEQQRDGGPPVRDEVGQAEGDFGGQTVLLRSWGQLGARSCRSR